MASFNSKSVFAIAKKEFLDNIRNKWIIVLTILLFLLVILFSYLAGRQSGGEDLLGDMQNTVFGLVGISSILIPLIAIILGFGTISGEAESGALSVVLSYPVKRVEILFGKLIGLGSVIIVSILVGFGFGGILITATVGSESWLSYIAFIGLTIFLGFIYLSLSICISSFFKRRITSIGGGLLIFFWGMIVGSILMGVVFASGFEMKDMMTGNFPEWYWYETLFSPMDLHQTTVTKAFGIETIKYMDFSIDMPEFLNIGLLLFTHLIWFIVPLILSYRFFKKRDI